MVNLAQPKAGDLILDPFCGTGGMLIEAGSNGLSQVVGFDAKPHMLRGGVKNMKHFGVEAEGFAIADARFPPITKVDCIATDPPYGRSASTLGAKTQIHCRRFSSRNWKFIKKGFQDLHGRTKKDSH